MRKLALVVASLFTLSIVFAPNTSANGGPVVDGISISTGPRSMYIQWHMDTSKPWKYRLGWFEIDPKANALFPDHSMDWWVYDTSPAIWNGFRPSTKYRVWIQVEVPGNGLGNPVYADVETGVEPPAGQQSTQVPAQPSQPVTAPPVPAQVCVPKTMVTRTKATLVRKNPNKLAVTGSTEYQVAFADGTYGWQGIPLTDYRLAVQKKAGGKWVFVTTVKPWRTTNISARRGTYRLSYTATCTQPGKNSSSRPVSR